MQRGDVDILKPQWLTDSIEKRKLVPLQSKYYFFATQEAVDDPAYHLDDDEVNATQHRSGPKSTQSNEEHAASLELAELPEYLRPVSADENLAHIPDDPSASETESDPEDLADDLSDGDWTEVAATTASAAVSAQSGGGKSAEIPPPLPPVPVPAPEPDPSNAQPSTVVSAIRIDASSSNSRLDQNLFFRDCCFYLDTPQNAQNEDFLVSTPHEAKIKQSMDRVRRDILVHGGSIAMGLSDPRLTHLVLHELDRSRRVDLSRRTAKPKRSYMVLTTFISSCIAENTLLDEDAFMP
ncbi:DNA ligase (ATP) [Ceratobasidium sp. 394]|nr:DNA ligase (ATP) [Ceratobasidium sp. 394]